MNWNERISPNVLAIPPSGIRRFFDIAAEMDDVVSLGVGEPDFITPWHIRESCVYGLERGFTAYTSNAGLLELREEIAHLFQTRHNVTYNPKNEILITVGVSEALDLAIRALLSPGDDALIPEPCYVSYKSCVSLVGANPIPVTTTMENNFQLTVEQLERAITPKTKLLLIGYPNNPTGAIMPREELMKIAEFAKAHDLIVLSDEIYGDLTYDAEHVCFSSLPGMKERTVVFNGFSKAYAMTGWRIGYALGAPEIIAAMTKIHQYTMLCAPITAQIAAVEALKNGHKQMTKMVKEYDCRRRLMVEGFRSMGLDCFEPKGAFYIFPSIKKTGMSSMEFAEQLLRQHKVAIVPGDAFGESGEGHVRCSYASSIANLNEALTRIEHFVRPLLK